MIIATRCPQCGKMKDMEVSQEAYQKWVSGTLIQNAFPELPADERERLITGICPPCWTKMFAEDDDPTY